jgi:ring-1,2-phenylacetyl-CoA epoxidase subunit PaaE
MAGSADFHPLRLSQVTRENGLATVLTFDVPPTLASTFRFKPGQFIALRAVIDGEEIRRSYSICAGPGEALRVAIKPVSDGRFSTWAFNHLEVGQTLDVAKPAGRFVLADATDQPRHIIAFAAGSGITPILGIIRQALDQDAATRVTLVYGNRGRETVLFGEDLEALKDRHLGRLGIISIFSRPGEVDSPLLEGRISGEKARALGETLIHYADASQIFLCGPGTMIKDVRDTLLGLGLPRDRVMHEFFAAGGGAFRAKPLAPVAQTAPVQPDTTVIAILDGVRTSLSLEPGEFVLQAALRAGIKAPYGCAGGMCCTCRAKIVEGTASMAMNYSLQQWEIDTGFVLTCQALPTSARLVVDWDAM